MSFEPMSEFINEKCNSFRGQTGMTITEIKCNRSVMPTMDGKEMPSENLIFRFSITIF